MPGEDENAVTATVVCEPLLIVQEGKECLIHQGVI
jgi:hypothetical protein